MCIECTKVDAALQDVDRIKLQEIHEELKLQEATNEERQLSSDNAYLEVKKLTSQYQKEAEKCNVGMETSEEAREKAEALLTLEAQKTKLWEYRARQLGWQEVRDKTNDFQSEEVSTLKLVELGGSGDTSVKSEAITGGKSEEENEDNQ
ncbi:hypothetical protein O6H91_Y104600 [Diphasiastrum complanatum]|nr:hypothetical protein O6H91_Y104600 [Diphasiastrum complanatum]